MNSENIKLYLEVKDNINYNKANDDYFDENYEIQRYNYHQKRDYGKWKDVKQLCNWSYANFDTDYLGDLVDNKLYKGRLFNDSNISNSDNKYIRSYKYLYLNINKIIITYTKNKNLTELVLNGPEMRHLLENFKVPTKNKRIQSMYSYFKSFIYNTYPSSYKSLYNFNIIDINIYLDDDNIINLNDIYINY